MHHSSDLIEMGGGKHGFNGRVGGNAQETPIGQEMGTTRAAASPYPAGPVTFISFSASPAKRASHCPRMPYIHIRPVSKSCYQVEP
jgi:hypothetical protein